MDTQLILDRYRLVERLASGGSAEVWRAEDTQLGRPVAVKRLHPHLFADPRSRARLAAEARAAARLSHPVIVSVYDVDASGDAPALVMELVDGESLAGRIEREGPLPARVAAAIVADVAEALFHAHQQGVVHRDVKPGNVLIGRDGRTRLVDFGIAQSLAEAAERLTVTGTVVGTLRAMAPEQLAGGPITPRTDLYGLGVVLHEALTGRPPYPPASPLALAAAQRAGPPPLDEVDPALAAAIAACLAHDPAARPLHAGALAAALRSWLAGDPAPALALAPSGLPAADPGAATETMPLSAVRGPRDAPPAAVPAAVPAATARSRARSKRGVWPALLLIGLAAVAVLGVMAWMTADPGSGVAAPTGSPPSTPVPTTPVATPPPPWLAELVEKVAKDCGEDAAAEAEAAMAAMDEEQAEDHADELVDACKEAAEEGRPGRGRGGNGNGPRDDD